MTVNARLRWSVLLPVKVLARAKSRLGDLAGPRRGELALALACDTVTAVLGCVAAARAVVITDDRVAAAALRDLGAHLELGVLPDILNDAGHSCLGLAATYPASLLVFGGDLGHARHDPPAAAVPPWLHALERAVGPARAAAVMTTQTRELLLP